MVITVAFSRVPSVAVLLRYWATCSGAGTRTGDQILARKLIKPGSPEVGNRLVHSAGATVMYEWTAWRDEAYKPLDSVIFIGLTLSDDFIGLGLDERGVRVAAALKERRREGQRH